MAHSKAQEDKELLLKDLCSRLPYGVKVQYKDFKSIDMHNINAYTVNGTYDVEFCKPYLRSMSSMTEEEKKEFETLGWRVDELDDNFPWPDSTLNVIKGIDWLNAHHFDYRGLIEKGLALEAPKGMYDK